MRWKISIVDEKIICAQIVVGSEMVLLPGQGPRYHLHGGNIHTLGCQQCQHFYGYDTAHSIKFMLLIKIFASRAILCT
jgi:hypothetical protein